MAYIIPENFTSYSIPKEELISLDVTFANYMIPRLKAFKDFTKSCPNSMTNGEWTKTLDKIIYSLEEISRMDVYEGNWNTVKEGLDLLAKHFIDLWS